MASEVSVSFKAYLRQNGDTQENPEVRRFGVDRDVVSSFTYMKEKLQTVFPSLKGKLFTISWRDADGDDVMISSDEELIIALTECKSDTYKLYVDVKGDLKDVPDSEAMHVEVLLFPDCAPGDDVHVGVCCDGCSGAVEGFRYKCAICPDYDLCSACEAKGVHSEHIMLRLPAPHMWHPRFKHNLVHRLAKSVRKSEAKEDGNRRWHGKHGHERHCSPDDQWHGKHGHGHGKHGHDRRCSPEEHRSRESAGRQRGGCPMRDHAGRPSFMDFLSSYMGENVAKDSMESKEYLKTIGRTVAQFLDPLGIAVNVEVRTDDDASTSKPKEGEKESQKESGEKQKTTEDEINVSTHTTTSVATQSGGSNVATPSAPEVIICENVEMMDETSQPRTPRPDTGDPELEHWTVVNNATSSAPAEEPEIQVLPHTSASASSNSEAQAHFYTSASTNQAALAALYAADAQRLARAAGAMAGAAVHPGGMLYPLLDPRPPMPPQQVPTTQTDAANHPVHPVHPDPKIVEAVTTMMAMGFSNEGGWLTQLLASKNGDISQALDVLQPVKRT